MTEQMHAVTERYAQRGAVFIGRTKDAITAANQSRWGRHG
jgi:hypothetical protein